MFLAKNWWMFLIRGIVALIFGVIAIFYPVSAFEAFVLIFGLFALVDGVVAIVSAFTSNAKSENWWWIIIGGVLGVVIGILTIVQPASMATALLLLIAAWSIVRGVTEIVTAIRIRKLIEGELWMILSGVLSVLFGVLVAMNPFSGAFAIGLIVGIYAVFFGIMLIALSFSLKKFGTGDIDGDAPQAAS